MSIFKKLFGLNSKGVEGQEESIKTNKKDESEEDTGFSITDYISIGIHGGNVGTATGSEHADFYVYEWFIKDTEEIFYVGKGRGDRYKCNHTNAYEAEKIRQMYDTDVRFVKKNLTEEEALELETEEITRILNKTNHRLTNRIVPVTTKRDNGYSRSPNTPAYEFEKASSLYACEIEEHYFGVKGRPFDTVELETLSHVVLIDKGISREELDIVYDGNYGMYKKEVEAILEATGHKIVKSKYAKSVTAWVYSGDDYVANIELSNQEAIERIGKTVPSYHLIDVWKLLKAEYNDIVIPEEAPVEINPIHTRVALSKIRNKNNWEKGFDAGYPHWEKGDKERKNGELEEAIRLFDLARYNGYDAPALYNSYAMAYRKLKDLDNEIDILTEGIERYRTQGSNHEQVITKLEDQKKKALEKLKKIKQ